jgi:gluconokinase
LWSYRVTADLHLIGGATSEGGNLYRWARETLQLPDDLMAELPNRAVDGHGLTVLPLLAGERSPGWSPDATGTITGIRLSTTPLDIVQALFESLALRLAIIFEQLGDLTDSNVDIIGNGGALSPYLAWTIASALNHPVQVTEETEITSRGAAMLALRALDATRSLDHPPAVAYVAEPDPRAVELLRKAQERQAELYRTMVNRKRSTN